MIVLAVSMATGAAIPASAVTHHVNPEGTGDFPTIQAAINAASEGDTIELCSGTFTGVGNRDIEYLGKAITVISQTGEPEGCIIDCQGTYEDPHRGFHFHQGEGPDSRLVGVSIINGYYSNDTDCQPGGAILCSDDSSPTVSHCFFWGNDASQGGAVACIDSATITMDQCVFQDNQAYCHDMPGSGIGGGIACTGSATAHLSRCILTGNGAYAGGAVHLTHNSSGNLDRCTLAHNVAAHYGGAIATSGGAELSISNSTLVDNDIGGFGSGIANWSNVRASAENTIIAFGCCAHAVVGGIDLACCDIYGNDGGDWVGDIAGQYGINGNISEDPLFCDPDTDDFRLDDDSPCAAGNHPDGWDCGLIGASPVGCGPSAVDESTGAVLALRRCAPNPFSSSTSIQYVIPVDSPVRLGIYDPAGRLVRDLTDTALHSGVHTASWDGTDGSGRRVRAGVYFYVLRWEGRTKASRVTLLR
jgi:predicted outer membrane repeat protein